MRNVDLNYKTEMIKYNCILDIFISNTLITGQDGSTLR